MTRFLMTTALVALTSTPLMAATHGNTELMIDREYQTMDNMQISAENLMGKTVYIKGADASPDEDWTNWTDVPAGWEDVADVSNIMIDQDGKLGSIVLDVGGFLGMGETAKTVTADNLKFVADPDDEGDYFVVYTGNKQLLGESDDYDAERLETDGYRSAMATETAMSTDMSETSENTDLTAEVVDDTTDENMADAMIDRSAMMPASLANMTTDDLEGVAIYGENDERVGEIGEMILGQDAMISNVVIDVGGFLGLGERHVSIALSDIELMMDESNNVVGFINMTEEQLEAMDEWVKDS